VTVRARLARPGWLAIEVADSGPGIPAGDLETVFDAFRQLGASSTRGTGGVGLGLSIVRQLTETLGGSVSVTSRLGEGSVFHVLLPCVVPAAAPVEMPSAADALDAAARNTTVVRGRARRAERRGPRHVRSPKL
jgi:K+-sensing histidine kinase KdpD